MKQKQNLPNSSVKKNLPLPSKITNKQQKKTEIEKSINQKKSFNMNSNSMKSNSIKKIQQSSKQLTQKKLLPKFESKKKESQKIKGWGFINFDLLLTINQYYASNPYDCYFLATICRVWRMHITSQNAKYFWILFNQCNTIQNFSELKKFLQKQLVQKRQKMSFQFQKHFIKLFNYGSTKQNIANKLIDKLDLQISVEINKKQLKKIPFKMRTFNFSSYLCFKVNQINQFKYDFYTPHNMFKDKLIIKVKFFSRKYKVSYEINYQYCPQDVIQMAIKQKAFNYFLDKNLILTFFQGDDHFLYMFFQMSALQLINTFRKNIKDNFKGTLDKKIKNLPMHKRLCETQFQNFIEYIKFQSDFQLHMSYHNSIKQIFTHCNTKVFPVQYDNKHAFFDIDVSDSFQKTSTYKLDNKMGMSENIDNLYLLDLVLKDRDNLLIIFSGKINIIQDLYTQEQQVSNKEKVFKIFLISIKIK